MSCVLSSLPDETIVPPDVPSYLSSQGTLSERQDVCIRMEAGGGPQPNGHVVDTAGTRLLHLCSDFQIFVCPAVSPTFPWVKFVCCTTMKGSAAVCGGLLGIRNNYSTNPNQLLTCSCWFSVSKSSISPLPTCRFRQRSSVYGLYGEWQQLLQRSWLPGTRIWTHWRHGVPATRRSPALLSLLSRGAALDPAVQRNTQRDAKGHSGIHASKKPRHVTTEPPW